MPIVGRFLSFFFGKRKQFLLDIMHETTTPNVITWHTTPTICGKRQHKKEIFTSIFFLFLFIFPFFYSGFYLKCFLSLHIKGGIITDRGLVRIKDLSVFWCGFQQRSLSGSKFWEHEVSNKVSNHDSEDTDFWRPLFLPVFLEMPLIH